MQAPKTPLFAPSRSQNRSYKGSATAGGAAPTKLGRRPFRQSP